MTHECTKAPLGWYCSRSAGHSGPCAAQPVTGWARLGVFFQRLRNKRLCWVQGHNYRRVSETLGGDWIRCTNCGHLDEYLPGLHEPKGYHDGK